MLVEKGCDPGAVGIGDLSDHQFVADGQYSCFLKVVHEDKGLNSCKEKGLISLPEEPLLLFSSSKK